MCYTGIFSYGATMGKSTELMQLLKTGNSDAARKLISKLKKTGRRALLSLEATVCAHLHITRKLGDSLLSAAQIA